MESPLLQVLFSLPYTNYDFIIVYMNMNMNILGSTSAYSAAAAATAATASTCMIIE